MWDRTLPCVSALRPFHWFLDFLVIYFFVTSLPCCPWMIFNSWASISWAAGIIGSTKCPAFRSTIFNDFTQKRPRASISMANKQNLSLRYFALLPITQFSRALLTTITCGSFTIPEKGVAGSLGTVGRRLRCPTPHQVQSSQLAAAMLSLCWMLSCTCSFDWCSGSPASSGHHHNSSLLYTLPRRNIPFMNEVVCKLGQKQANESYGTWCIHRIFSSKI